MAGSEITTCWNGKNSSVALRSVIPEAPIAVSLATRHGDLLSYTAVNGNSVGSPMETLHDTAKWTSLSPSLVA